MGSFPARDRHKPGLSQISDQLVDFSRHAVTADRYSSEPKGVNAQAKKERRSLAEERMSPQAFPAKGVTRSGFQVALKSERGGFVVEGDIPLEPPRTPGSG